MDLPYLALVNNVHDLPYFTAVRALKQCYIVPRMAVKLDSW